MSTQILSPADAPIAPAGVWNIDPSHSTIGFSVKHMMIATVRGHFTEFAGSITIDDASGTVISGIVQAGSIDTNEPQRDEHLRSGDFFDAANYPQILFTSTGIERRGDGQYALVGDLTIKDVTRQVTLDATVNGEGVDPWGNQRLALEARGQINRKDYGLNWNQLLETGGVLVGEKVTITLDLSTVRAAA